MIEKILLGSNRAYMTYSMKFFLSSIGLSVIEIIEKKLKKMYLNFSLRIDAISYVLTLDIFDFSFLCATLKAFSIFSMRRITMVDSAFERAWSDAYDCVMYEWYRRLEISLWIEISMGRTKKLENPLFLIVEFCFHGTTLEGDLAR